MAPVLGGLAVRAAPDRAAPRIAAPIAARTREAWPVPETLQNLAVMLRSSWRADRRRSLGALATTALLPVTRPLRAIGLGVMADGAVDHELRTAVTGGVIVAALTGASRVLDWASVTLRMRLRENTILFL